MMTLGLPNMYPQYAHTVVSRLHVVSPLQFHISLLQSRTREQRLKSSISKLFTLLHSQQAGLESLLLPFRSLDIFILSTKPQFIQLYK